MELSVMVAVQRLLGMKWLNILVLSLWNSLFFFRAEHVHFADIFKLTLHFLS